MATFKIATWNVNSLRVRLPHVQEWIVSVKPDVLALQETKLATLDDFPLDDIHQAGYTVIASGQKAYNGVAILSRDKITDVITDIPELDDTQRRVLCATIGDICVLNIYVPNGENVLSAKYEYKLNWLNKLNLFLQQQLKKHNKIIVLGDFNIAPEEIDVHDPKLWEGQVLFSQPERQAFHGLINLGFKDCFRKFPQDEKSFSWWDYRMGAFRRNRGLRIDHILANEKFAVSCTHCYIDKIPRSWERPSDHTPVIAEFEI